MEGFCFMSVLILVAYFKYIMILTFTQVTLEFRTLTCKHCSDITLQYWYFYWSITSTSPLTQKDFKVSECLIHLQIDRNLRKWPQLFSLNNMLIWVLNIRVPVGKHLKCSWNMNVYLDIPGKSGGCVKNQVETAQWAQSLKNV